MRIHPLLDMNTGHSNSTTNPQEATFCPPFPNAYFETLDSSVPYFVGAVLNGALAMAATFANLVVLLAMRRVTSIRLPSKLLLCSLVLTDLGAGLVAQPLFAAFFFMKVLEPSSVQCSLRVGFNFTGSMFSGASFLTLTAISLDRYAALYFHLRYQHVVTTRRVLAGLSFIWSFSLLIALISFWKFWLWWILVIVSLSIGVPVLSVISIKIYRRLRIRQTQPQDSHQAQQRTGNSLTMQRYRRTASAMLWVFVLFVLCYSPFLIIALVFAITPTALVAFISDYTYIVVLLNSCLNPFVYCLRLPEIRTEFMKQLRKFCCRSSPW